MVRNKARNTLDNLFRKDDGSCYQAEINSSQEKKDESMETEYYIRDSVKDGNSLASV